MTLIDYIVDLALIALVIFQIQDRRIDFRSLIRPVVIVAFAAIYYLKAVPLSGNDVPLYLILGGAGLVLGSVCALTTTVWFASDGSAHSKAGVIAAIFWVVGVGTRLAFEEYATHGGEPSILRFSAHHDITSQNAWVSALVIMALVEVLARLAIIRLRAAHVKHNALATTNATPVVEPAA